MLDDNSTSEVTCMATNSSPPLSIIATKINETALSNSLAETNHLSMLWKMRWFLLIVILIWLLAAMIATIVVICLTKNPLSLSFFSTLAPPAYLLYWITKHLFPMDERRFQLEAMKIQSKMQRASEVKKLDREGAERRASHHN